MNDGPINPHVLMMRQQADALRSPEGLLNFEKKQRWRSEFDAARAVVGDGRILTEDQYEDLWALVSTPWDGPA